jgi:hypothetical protein
MIDVPNDNATFNGGLPHNIALADQYLVKREAFQSAVSELAAYKRETKAVIELLEIAATKMCSSDHVHFYRPEDIEATENAIRSTGNPRKLDPAALIATAKTARQELLDAWMAMSQKCREVFLPPPFLTSRPIEVISVASALSGE